MYKILQHTLLSSDLSTGNGNFTLSLRPSIIEVCLSGVTLSLRPSIIEVCLSGVTLSLRPSIIEVCLSGVTLSLRTVIIEVCLSGVTLSLRTVIIEVCLNGESIVKVSKSLAYSLHASIWCSLCLNLLTIKQNYCEATIPVMLLKTWILPHCLWIMVMSY